MNDEVVNNLPEDTDTLQKLIVDYHQEVVRLREQIKLMQHRKFAKKSEKTDPAQLSFFDEPEPPKEEPEPQEESVEVKSYSRKKRTTLPKELPREQKHYDLNDDEKVCACGGALCWIGKETYEQLEYIPATVKVIERIKPNMPVEVARKALKQPKCLNNPSPKVLLPQAYCHK